MWEEEAGGGNGQAEEGGERMVVVPMTLRGLAGCSGSGAVVQLRTAEGRPLLDVRQRSMGVSEEGVAE